MPDLKLLGIVSGHADGGEPRLRVATPAGRVREVQLGRTDLVKLIQQAASSLEVLDRRETPR